ncbi:MAG: D-alanyl-D-alanine carboxypeptidase/D-alanyl-D-alanine-endopeptidase [Actinomycetota bacterium]|nr:D-alanyl-D-alanine carboxypeptidase/D-alanyl-D-alanine-endopeptidase [Actinomycetota bacterium]MDP2287728.1 D-alanyl-D-alanine carboxypeptidase/D-alanyl-D-alanine-endopeptidase [Actinomycetota bacterium]
MTHRVRLPLILAILLLTCGLSAQAPATADASTSPVLPALPVAGSTAPIPTTAGLSSVLTPLLSRPALGTSALWVADPASGATLLESRAQTALSPASTLKLLTAATALRALGSSTRLATRVVSEGSTVTLVGGGDATLPSQGAGASLATLADKTAKALPGASVNLVYDISLFTGRTLGAGWSRSFPAAGVVAPVQALMMDQGRANPRGNSRVSNPAQYAARAFAKMLRARGVKVGSVIEGKAAADAIEIARVESAPVQQLVHHMLTDSDNDLAEALAHLSGAKLTGVGSFKSGAQAMTKTATELGLPTQGIALSDGSGLSSRDRVAAQTLGSILMLSAQGSFGGIAPSLAIAGFTGTLSDRFTSARQSDAAGFVRAKTGTLNDVVTLAGIVPDIDGRVLVFAVMANDVPSIGAARTVVDQIATKLRACGCTEVKP